MLRSVVQFACLALLAAAVSAQDPVGNEFQPPTALDQRCPCPFLNTLANHAFLPRNGFNVSRAQMNAAFDTVFNIDPAVTDPIVTKSLAGTTSAFPDTINLSDLNKHNLIEHDVSLSRSDGAVGDAVGFNATIWDSVASFFTTPTISTQQLAQARSARIVTARAQNPAVDFGAAGQMANLAETSFLSIIFSGGGTDGGANAAQVDALFRQERIPTAQGYVRPAQRMFPDTVMLMGQKITNASTPAVARRSRRRS